MVRGREPPGIQQPTLQFPATVENPCAAVRNEEVVGLANKVRLLNLPQRRGDPVIVIADLQPVLQNAAKLDARQGEDHLVVLVTAVLEIHKIRGLRDQADDGPIRVNGAPLDGGHLG